MPPVSPADYGQLRPSLGDRFGISQTPINPYNNFASASLRIHPRNFMDNFRVCLTLDPNDFMLIQAGQFADKASDKIRLKSPVDSPWGQTWKLVPLPEKGRSRGGLVYLKRLTFKLFPLEEHDDYLDIQLRRERWKGDIFDSLDPTIRCWCVWVEPPQNQLIYSISRP
ncbi:hypothetical protein [Laspinema olomoucense]|uniref:Uncharacterized protein n=1 Tax=Laspinema olomoucense D3b TaxID=2953688 RepID=A0ABT2N4K8_9CYAN|nr:hypothetical protein [Laspinema sp. D3b]MCT7977621.1 hypothetical protein [Laspinema sp. D3b]